MTPLYENDHFTIQGIGGSTKLNLIISNGKVLCRSHCDGGNCVVYKACTAICSTELDFIRIIAPGFLDQHPELLL